jgi:hypothetical protein
MKNLLDWRVDKYVAKLMTVFCESDVLLDCPWLVPDLPRAKRAKKKDFNRF